jgi:hypothetical protein
LSSSAATHAKMTTARRARIQDEAARLDMPEAAEPETEEAASEGGFGR